ncbi:MAG: response regulator transcription factor [Clostridiaceae bacterium]|nr:response regulator transcription factor [Clostridiaceae bacterium]
MDNKKILVVEDEFSINDTLKYSIKREGFKVASAYTGKEAMELFLSFKPDLVLLDLMLPDMSGFDICKEISTSCYVIMLTARDDMSDKIMGMEIGADDYITKPFEIREVIARINAIFRRAGKKIEKTNNEISGLIIDEDRRLVIKEGKEILLKRKEFEILNFLCKNKGKVFTRDELLNNIWGYDYYGDTRTVDVHIRRLRASLGEDKGDSTVETVFGVGYVVK